MIKQAIEKPLIVILFTIAIILMGIYVFGRINVERLPNLPVPIVLVKTTMPGASAKQVDLEISRIIDKKINNIDGIKHVFATSYPGISFIKAEFELQKDPNEAFLQVQAKINQVLNQLPKQASSPVVSRFELTSMPIVWLVLHSEKYGIGDLSDYATSFIKEQLENLPGVAEVQLAGAKPKIVHIALLPEKMSVLGIDVQQVFQAFSTEHVNVPAGFVISKNKEFLLDLNLQFNTIAKLRRMIISYRKGHAIRLQDVAEVDFANKITRDAATYNNQPSVGLGVVKLAERNTIKIVAAVKNQLQQKIIPHLPAGISITMVNNQAKSILRDINSLTETIWISILCAALIVWLFLKNLRATLIIAAVVPVSLFGAILAMYFTGNSFNTLTLLSLILLVGVVVDDAIVVLENIYRHSSSAKISVRDAALPATQNVVFPVFASSLSLIIIFTTVLFMKGLLNIFFKPFSVIVVAGVATSFIASLTLTPTLCAQFLRLNKLEQGSIYKLIGRGFDHLNNGYNKILAWSLKLRWQMVGLAIIVVLPAIFMFLFLGKGLFPRHENSDILTIVITTPRDSNLAYTENRLQQATKILLQNPAVKSSFATIGPAEVNKAKLYVALNPQVSNHIATQKLILQLQNSLDKVPGTKALVTTPPLISSLKQPLEIALLGPDYSVLHKLSTQLQAALQQHPKLGRFRISTAPYQTQYQLTVNRELAHSMGLTTLMVAQSSAMLGGGAKVGIFTPENSNKHYDIYLQSKQGEFINPEDLNKIYIYSNKKAPIRLNTVATLHRVQNPAVMQRVDQEYGVIFDSTPAMSLNFAINSIRSIVNKILPNNFHMELLGQSESSVTVQQGIVEALVLSFLLLYLVLACQFGSLLQPIIVLVAQPLAILGVIYTLWLFNMSLNIFSMIGILLLMGLVAKNSILLVSLTNKLRKEGCVIDEALKKACPQRMRPVIMTSMTIILAMVPPIFSIGPGAKQNQALAATIISGIFVSTILTLIIMPAMYSLLENNILKIKKHFVKAKQE